MRKILALSLGLAALSACQKPPAPAESAGPKLGLQAYTFRAGPLVDAIDQTSKLGIHYLEIYPGQTLGGGMNGKVIHTMDAGTRDTLKKFAADRGVVITSYGVVNGGSEAEWKSIFDFAKAMNLRWITVEPGKEWLPLLSQLAKESGIKVAIHNHAAPSTYADPAVALAAVEPFGPEIGLCADTGHWARSGFDPVESLRKCQSRLITLHFKDMNERTITAHDMPWGTGTSDAAGQIAVLRESGFDGVVLGEYEHESPRLLEDLALCAEFFRSAVAAPLADLVGGKVAPPGFVTDVPKEWADHRGEKSLRWPAPTPLLTPDLSNAEFTAGSWTFKDGVLSAKGGGGDLWTKESYGDFVLSLEFRCGEKTNSGVFLRCSDIVNWLHSAIEVQILQGDEPDSKHVVGAIFDCLAPTRQLPIKPGEWNQYVITAKGPKIKVRLNDEDVVDMNLDDWTTAGKNPDGTPNKFQKAYKDMARSGRIGLQDHGDPIEFRNLLIEKL
jgi:sugar phosphate isomerase/epimerase